MFPDPEQLETALKRVRPVIAQLGPEGYRVLPGYLLARLETDDVAVVRAEMLENIEQRRNDYYTLVRKIDAGDIDWLHFQPIIKDLLALADPDVQEAIIDELDCARIWGYVEMAVVGLATIALLLLLTIFPPTTVLGVAGLAVLETSLGAYSIVRGAQAIDTGHTYLLGQGANDVFTRQQQDMGGFLVATGFLGVVTGIMQVSAGLARGASVASAAAVGGESAAALTRLLPAGRTLQRGAFLLTIENDGSIVATVAGRPDILIVVRGGIVRVYQTLGEGTGVRLAFEGPLTSLGPAGAPVPAQPAAIAPVTPEPAGALVPVKPQLPATATAPLAPSVPVPKALAPIAGAEEVRVSPKQYETALGHVLPGQALDVMMSTIEQTGQNTAAVLVKDPSFVSACENGNWTLAGTKFHAEAAIQGRALATKLPPGYSMRFELTVQAGKGGSRLDILGEGPGLNLEVDWKTTERSAISYAARKEMAKHASQTATNLGLANTQQLSKSWVDFVRPYLPNVVWP
jgi:hypothetical protein